MHSVVSHNRSQRQKQPLCRRRPVQRRNLSAVPRAKPPHESNTRHNTKPSHHPHAIAQSLGAPWLDSSAQGALPTTSAPNTRKYEQLIKCADPEQKAALRESRARVVYADMDGFDRMMDSPIEDARDLPQIPAKIDLTSSSCPSPTGNSSLSSRPDGSSSNYHALNFSHGGGKSSTSSPMKTTTSSKRRYSQMHAVHFPIAQQNNSDSWNVPNLSSQTAFGPWHHSSRSFTSVLNWLGYHDAGNVNLPTNMTPYRRLTASHGVSAQKTSLDDGMYPFSSGKNKSFHFPIGVPVHGDDMYGTLDRQTVPQSENGLENYAGGINFDASLYSYASSVPHIPSRRPSPDGNSNNNPKFEDSAATSSLQQFSMLGKKF